MLSFFLIRTLLANIFHFILSISIILIYLTECQIFQVVFFLAACEQFIQLKYIPFTRKAPIPLHEIGFADVGCHHFKKIILFFRTIKIDSDCSNTNKNHAIVVARDIEFNYDRT